MDNSGGIGYNDNIGNTFLAGKDPFEASMGEWYKKYNDSLKYAGDRAKKSIVQGLMEASSYIKDASPDTNFTDVQTASVKRSLAKDANDKGLYNSAVMEMIGHLSRENKEPYLKQAKPLQTYIDAKDNFDFNHNNYTTTQNIDQTPDENVRQLQRGLNAEGYTDKMGQPLKEDGILGGKTLYAYDTSRANVQTTLQSQLFKNTLSASEPVAKITNNLNNTVNQIKTKIKTVFDKYIPYYSEESDNIKLSDNGKLSENDKKYNKIKQTLLKCLSANWYGTAYNKEFQDYIHEQANRLREYDDNSFEKVVLLNKSTGASNLGHNAVMLINKDNEGLIFSFYSTSSNFIKSVRTQAEVRFGVLNSEEVNNLLYKNNKNVLFFTASDNSIVRETYDNFKTYNLNSTGYNMYNAAVALYDCPSYYSLVSRHCDIIAVELLKEGGIDINRWVIPNWTYENN